MARVAAVIMAHPRRRALLEETILPAYAPARPLVVYDPEPDGEPACWRCARLAWMVAFRQPASHVLIATDDALPCSRYLEAATHIAGLTGSRIVSFYSARKAVVEAVDAGRHWATIPGRDFYNPMGLMLPVMLARSMVAWIDREAGNHPEWKPTSDDTRYSAYFAAERQRVWLSAPSLVQHISPGESLLPGHANSRRVATRWIGADGDPFTIDWTRGIDD